FPRRLAGHQRQLSTIAPEPRKSPYPPPAHTVSRGTVIVSEIRRPRPPPPHPRPKRTSRALVTVRDSSGPAVMTAWCAPDGTVAEIGCGEPGTVFPGANASRGAAPTKWMTTGVGRAPALWDSSTEISSPGQTGTARLSSCPPPATVVIAQQLGTPLGT